MSLPDINTTSHIALTIPEIVDQIVQVLGNDRSGLTCCSLVCREWANLTARYLFATITFNPTYLSRSLANDTLLRPMHAWLVNKPRVVNNVREVIIDPARNAPMSFPTLNAFSYICPQLIGDIHATFPHLRSMQFATAYFVTEPHPSLLSDYPFSVPSTTSPISRLVLHVVSSTFVKTPMVDVLGAFSGVDTLVLRVGGRLIDSSLASTQKSAPLLHRSRVRALVVRDATSLTADRLWRMLGLSVDPNSLVSLSVLDHGPLNTALCINEFIREHASHIHHFAFSTNDRLGFNFCLPATHSRAYFCLDTRLVVR